jgi:hypothetical protein
MTSDEGFEMTFKMLYVEVGNAGSRPTLSKTKVKVDRTFLNLLPLFRGEAV